VWTIKKAGAGRAGSGKKKLEKVREGEPVSIVLKTSFHPLSKRQQFKDVKCQNVDIFGVELNAGYHYFTACFDLLSVGLHVVLVD